MLYSNNKLPSSRYFKKTKIWTQVFLIFGEFLAVKISNLRSSRQQHQDDKGLLFKVRRVVAGDRLKKDNYPQPGSLYHHLPYGHN